ncbi:AbrB/MazE/SpoVT family DNA-binding domain-containing protein [Candidatus Berkelbacteria bacterium]|nr:AbrB/MazE/SpoVT family DNA-binding domain-containing protein [Candidatus Berkelbacteria bacterium]
MTIVRVREKGQITLPKSLREQVGIEEDTPLGIAVSRGKIILEPLTITPYPIRDYTKTEIEKFVKEDQFKTPLSKKLRTLLRR